MAAGGPEATSVPTDETLVSRGAGRRAWNGAPPRRGDTLGRYLIVDTLGRGGMGVVYAAYDPELDRKIAVKVLAQGLPSDASGRRLVSEAKAMAKLSHPNVVSVYDVAEADGAVFLAMELVEGRTLARWLEDAPRTLREILEVFVPAGRGLAAAHAAGLVHRDFKPHNVMVADDGRVVVLDFGIARRSPGIEAGRETEEPPSDSVDASQPETMGPVGTPAFMSPEQIERAVVDARTDQFSFCVSLYRAVYGEAPFAGASVAELGRAVLEGRVTPQPRDTGVPVGCGVC